MRKNGDDYKYLEYKNYLNRYHRKSNTLKVKEGMYKIFGFKFEIILIE